MDFEEIRRFIKQVNILAKVEKKDKDISDLISLREIITKFYNQIKAGEITKIVNYYLK